MKVINNEGVVFDCPKEDELHVIRHTAAHIMAQAIKRLYPNAAFAYGRIPAKGCKRNVCAPWTKYKRIPTDNPWRKAR